MKVLEASPWDQYQLLDSGEARRLERFGNYVLSRPDPGAMWKRSLPVSKWEKVDAEFVFVNGNERWVKKNNIPETWLMKWKDVSFYAKLTPFKHTGVFSEQTAQWEWMRGRIETGKLRVENDKKINILNLFGYTGIATLVAASVGAAVTHVDGSKPTIGWLLENIKASGFEDKPIRWILDDALVFVRREVKRGKKYDGIIMDPPVYGHGPEGQVWDFSKDFPKLLEACKDILSEKPLFIIVNAYAVSASAIMLENMLSDMTSRFAHTTLEAGELALKEEGRSRLLSTGIYGRVEFGI